jgi:fused signal recognition particle receptor
MSLLGGLARSRRAIGERLAAILGRSRGLSPGELEEIERVLLEGDVGPEAAEMLVRTLGSASGPERGSPMERLAAEMTSMIPPPSGPPSGERPSVTMFVGTNGSGKTTTIARLAASGAGSGRRVLMACADTFRAAASEQTSEWGRRIGVETFLPPPGGDPAAAAYDAVRRGVGGGFDDVLVDTAGRLGGRGDLLAELGKIQRVCGKALPGAPHATLLVLDASMGQSALPQARLFSGAVALTGLVLTKLDGTARGGAVISVARELGLPVEYAGTGEGAGDLEPFSPESFVRALLGGG